MGFIYFSFFFFKQKTAYDVRISDWSSDVCSSDLEFALFGDERGECRLRLGAGVGGDAEYAIAAIDPQRPVVTLGEMRLPPGQHRPDRPVERVRRHAATSSKIGRAHV